VNPANRMDPSRNTREACHIGSVTPAIITPMPYPPALTTKACAVLTGSVQVFGTASGVRCPVSILYRNVVGGGGGASGSLSTFHTHATT
jgi:hypothetical protein